MAHIPPAVQRFLAQRRIAVAGVSRQPDQPANLIFRRLRATGHEVFAVNPAAQEVEGEPCWPRLAAIPGGVGAVMVVTPLAAAAGVVAETADLGIRHVWLHRGIGPGSLSEEAVRLGRERGLDVIAGGCPMMYAGAVDPCHRMLSWFRGPQALREARGFAAASAPAGVERHTPAA